jgi:ketosteroid isomerase-like protein
MSGIAPAALGAGRFMSPSDIIRRYIAAFQAKDRQTVDALLSDDLTFTSPVDRHLDKAGYFERCWPNADKVRILEIEKLVEQGDEAFIRYRAQRTADDVKFRNTEYIKCAGGRIRVVEVYFGAEE